MNSSCHQVGLCWHGIQGIWRIQEELLSIGARFGVRHAALMVLPNSLLKAKRKESISSDPPQQKGCCCPLNAAWKNSHALQVPVVILVMQRWENNLLWGLDWLWLREWNGAGSTQLLHLFLPERHQTEDKPLTDKHGSSRLKSQPGTSAAGALLREGTDYMHWVFSTTERRYLSNCFEMQARRGVLCNVSWAGGNLCYKSKLSLVDFISFLFNQTPDHLHLKDPCFVTLLLLDKY